MHNISRSTRVAAKNHMCDYCGQVIQKGEIYERSFNKFDGHVYSWKNHIKCQKIAGMLNMFDGCDEGLTGDEFRNNIREEFMYLKSDQMEDNKYRLPDFPDMLNFVIDHHLLKNETALIEKKRITRRYNLHYQVRKQGIHLDTPSQTINVSYGTTEPFSKQVQYLRDEYHYVVQLTI